LAAAAANVGQNTANPSAGAAIAVPAVAKVSATAITSPILIAAPAHSPILGSV
jgi:hypothetical protein